MLYLTTKWDSNAYKWAVFERALYLVPNSPLCVSFHGSTNCILDKRHFQWWSVKGCDKKRLIIYIQVKYLNQESNWLKFLY